MVQSIDTGFVNGCPIVASSRFTRCLFPISCFAILVIGCNQGGPEFAEVVGVVTLDGQPVSDVEVVFMPIADSTAIAPRSACYTDKDGRYSMRTDKGIEGAVLGSHYVLFNDTAFLPLPPGAPSDAAPPRPTRPPVPDIYRVLGQTPIEPVDVQPGMQTHDFHLVSDVRSLGKKNSPTQ